MKRCPLRRRNRRIGPDYAPDLLLCPLIGGISGGFLRRRPTGRYRAGPARVAEWHTRVAQNHLAARPCGFESRPGHPCPVASDRASGCLLDELQEPAGVAIHVDGADVAAAEAEAERVDQFLDEGLVELGQ